MGKDDGKCLPEVWRHKEIGNKGSTHAVYRCQPPLG
jgi:hypothetical protein